MFRVETVKRNDNWIVSNKLHTGGFLAQKNNCGNTIIWYPKVLLMKVLNGYLR